MIIHGARSSVVERQIVDLVVMGSSPIGHSAPVAQPDRATDFESVGRTFESCQAHFGPLAQLVEQQTLNLWVEGSIPSWLSPFVYVRRLFSLLRNSRCRPHG